MTNILFVIPARSGSRRLPDKNIMMLGLKPLLTWSLDTAIKAGQLIKADHKDWDVRIIVSTDSEHYQKIANSWIVQARVEGRKPAPFLRPADISEDVDTGLVCRHAMFYADDEMGFETDYVVTLQPTSPFRDPKEVKHMVDLVHYGGDVEMVFSVKPVTEFPRWMFTRNERGYAKSYEIPVGSLSGDIAQDQPDLYMPNGSVYVTKAPVIMDGKIYGQRGRDCLHVMEEAWKNVDIEEEIDFKWAEFLLKEGYVPEEAQ